MQGQGQGPSLQGIRQGQGLDLQGQGQGLDSQGPGQVQDLNLVLKESLRTKTRTSLTVTLLQVPTKPTIAIKQQQ